MAGSHGNTADLQDTLIQVEIWTAVGGGLVIVGQFVAGPATDPAPATVHRIVRSRCSG